MTKIFINHFFVCSEDSFYQYLRLHRPSFIEVIIPKKSNHLEPELIIDDYYRALYTGQLLSRISVECMFNIPAPETEGEFGFIIITTQLKKLAGILYLLSRAYDFDNHYKTSLEFSQTAADVEGYLVEDEDLLCQPYLDILEDYLENW